MNIINIVTLFVGLIAGFFLTNISNDLTILALTILLVYALEILIIELLIYNNQIKLLSTGVLNVLSIHYNKDMRCLIITMSNDNLLEDEELFRSIYNTFTSIDEYKNFGNFKIAILSCVLQNDKEYNLHPNIVINNDTTFDEYYKIINDNMDMYVKLHYGYNNESIARFNLTLWNADDKRNLKIKQSLNTISYTTKDISQNPNKSLFNNINRKSYSTKATNWIPRFAEGRKHWSAGVINPLSLYNIKGELKQKFANPFFAVDIETVKFNGHQIPIAISSCGCRDARMVKKLIVKYF